MRRYKVLYLLLLISVSGFSQNKPVQLGQGASDCMGALMINDTVVGPVFSPKGFGKKLEINGYELGDPYYIEREHNTVWYKFRAPYEAVFTFDLIPEVENDDFDFLLFQYDGPNFCRDVADGRKIPIRTNISRKNIHVDGRTGLSEGSIDEYVPSGPGSSYSKPVRVKKGDLFYLLVDNPFKENEGHTIHLKFRQTSPTVVQLSKPDEVPTYKVPFRKLKLTIVDAVSNERIASDISIDGLADSVSSNYVGLSVLELDVVSYRSYEINVVKKGYLLATESFIPKNDSLYEVEMKMKPMKLGDRINLDNIKFETDKTKILEKSLPALDQLKAFLDVNPSITIDIQGHVNGEGKKNKKKFISLSKERAEAIYEKLVDAGVSANRITYQGFGNAKMIYPTPVNNRQSEANRRVEIEITSL